MDNEKIYTAQLNASKKYNDENINNLISSLEGLISETESVEYNDKTKTINIKVNKREHPLDDDNIRLVINSWLESLSLDEEDVHTLQKYNNYAFNITKIDYPYTEGHIIAIYLF